MPAVGQVQGVVEEAVRLVPERLAVATEFATNMIARRAQEIDIGVMFRFPEEQFLSNLVDMTVAALLAPISTSRRPSPR